MAQLNTGSSGQIAMPEYRPLDPKLFAGATTGSMTDAFSKGYNAVDTMLGESGRLKDEATKAKLNVEKNQAELARLKRNKDLLIEAANAKDAGDLVRANNALNTLKAESERIPLEAKTKLIKATGEADRAQGAEEIANVAQEYVKLDQPLFRDVGVAKAKSDITKDELSTKIDTSKSKIVDLSSPINQSTAERMAAAGGAIQEGGYNKVFSPDGTSIEVTQTKDNKQNKVETREFINPQNENETLIGVTTFDKEGRQIDYKETKRLASKEVIAENAKINEYNNNLEANKADLDKTTELLDSYKNNPAKFKNLGPVASGLARIKLAESGGPVEQVWSAMQTQLTSPAQRAQIAELDQFFSKKTIAELGAYKGTGAVSNKDMDVIKSIAGNPDLMSPKNILKAMEAMQRIKSNIYEYNTFMGERKGVVGTQKAGEEWRELQKAKVKADEEAKKLNVDKNKTSTFAMKGTKPTQQAAQQAEPAEVIDLYTKR
jgi:hypothetical protein